MITHRTIRRPVGWLLIAASVPASVVTGLLLLGIRDCMIAVALVAAAIGGPLAGSVLTEPARRRPTPAYCCAVAEFEGAPSHPCEATA